MQPENPSSGRHPIHTYRVALTHVAERLGASFAAVFLRDDQDDRLLRPACVCNWPQRSARFLGQMRIRIGRGPTGRSVAVGRAVAVDDIFADPHKDWWEPARELGFVAMTAEPIVAGDGVVGALSLYFQGPTRLQAEHRVLLRSVAEQLSVTA